MRTTGLASLALAATAALSAIAAAPATASLDLTTAGERPAYEPDWAPADEATIHPGTQVRTEQGQCTSNFIFAEVTTDAETGVESLTDVLIGMAAHCSGTGEATDTNGCDSGSLPLGAEVEIDGAEQPGEMVYNSWLTMQQVGETEAGACEANDFALVSIHPDDWASVNPSLPVWGGPHGVNTEGVAVGEDLYSFGNSGLRLGVEELSPKIETKAATEADGWSHVVYAVSPGVPGDSGSGHVDSEGRAFGVTSTLYLFPYPTGNGISDLGRALAYANEHTAMDLRLVDGTEEFSPLL